MRIWIIILACTPFYSLAQSGLERVWLATEPTTPLLTVLRSPACLPETGSTVLCPSHYSSYSKTSGIPANSLWSFRHSNGFPHLSSDASCMLDESTASPLPSVMIPHKIHLAFFCQIEEQATKAARIPVRFRLGTVDYVDRLEGKRSY